MKNLIIITMLFGYVFLGGMYVGKSNVQLKDTSGYETVLANIDSGEAYHGR